MEAISEIIESGEVARLIPVIADSRREQRVASVFLATLSAVPDFAQVLLSTLGVRLGKRAFIDTYTEVVLKGHKDTKDRPDGLIVVSSGKNTWKALVEAKIGNASLDDDQVQRYLQISRDCGIDAVISISNQFAVRPTHSPVKVNKVLTRRVDLFHWSWKMILTEAVLLQTRGVVTDPDQAFLLREFIRFLSHDSIGITGFDQMPKEWKDLVTLVKSGGTIAKGSREAQSVVAAWHQEMRDLALRISQHLASNVNLKLSRAQAASADQFLSDDVGILAVHKRLEAELDVPNAASTLRVTADLTRQTIRVGMELDAPQDRKRSVARVNWLLRQIRGVEDPALFVRIIWPSKAQDTVCRLADLRENADQIVGNAPYPPKSFEVFLLVDDGRRFPGRKTFIEDLERAVPRFYDNVGQNLERWIAKPPKPVAVSQIEQDDGVARGDPATKVGEEAGPKDPPRLNAGNQHAALLEIPRFLQREPDRGPLATEVDSVPQAMESSETRPPSSR
ncbi:MAG: hypothetical protein ACFCUW_09930 [Kiloniellaceae bacterium]